MAPVGAPGPEPMPVPVWDRFIALGDSLTEGMVDAYPERELAHAGLARTAGRAVDPDGGARYRGWADLLARELSRRRIAAGQAPLTYLNLAIRGRLLGEIVEQQVPAARPFLPDADPSAPRVLVSLIGGGNDILRPGVRVTAIARRLEDAVASLRASGADVLLATGTDVERAPLLSATRGPVGIFNSMVWSIARRHGCYVNDHWGLTPLQTWAAWGEDRIHPNELGHRLIARTALETLGLDPVIPGAEPWRPDEPAAARLRERVATEVAWLRRDVLPWVGRRVRRSSSGARRRPKHARPVVVDVPVAAAAP